jgi:hypothetical protein
VAVVTWKRGRRSRSCVHALVDDIPQCTTFRVLLENAASLRDAPLDSEGRPLGSLCDHCRIALRAGASGAVSEVG